jgi:two-component system phosphate regulon sensor histidine kinase PhoR
VKLNIRARLFLVLLGLIAASVFTAELYLRPQIENGIVDRIRNDLFARLALVEQAAHRVQSDDASGWDALADDLGRRAHARVTFIAPDGQVLGDSEVPRDRLSSLENHRDRPEVAAALAGRPGSSMRWSATVHNRLMYAAMPLEMSGLGLGVARLAVPLSDVDAAVRQLRGFLLVATLIALLMAVVASTVAAQLLSRELRRMTDVARRMSAGELEVRTRVARGHDEVAELGRALDHLAGSLSGTLGELRSERDLLGRVLESMREGMLVLDGGGRVLLVNPALRAMLQLGPGVEGKAPLEVVRNVELQRILQFARETQASSSGEIEVAGGAMSPRRLLVHASPLPAAAGGEPPGLLAVFVDVTEIRRLETLRKDFVANVSHELRTPVTAVRSAVETLRLTLDRDPSSSARFVDMIERNAERLGELIEDLLDLSRIESRDYRPELEAITVRAVAEQVVSLLHDRAEQKGLRLSIAVDENCPPVLADRRALEQVITNLVDNAVKYCSPGASVTIRARDGSGDDLRIQVEDTGPGIERRHQARVFERFYRVDSGRSRDMGGTGLGLSIVKHLVEVMDGTVGVDSTPGKGSTFWFELPRAQAVDTQSPRL